MLNNSLGEDLRTARRAHGLSQERVAFYAQITQEYLSMIECGERIPSDARAALIIWVINHISESGEPTGDFSGRDAFIEKFNKGGLPMSIGQYPYLASEDGAFGKAFRLSEDEVLGLFGGLKGYATHRLNRTKAREGGIEIPRLSSDFEAAIKEYELADIDEKGIAEDLVGKQVTKVRGAMDTLEMNKRYSEQAAAQAKTEEQVKEAELKKLRQWYATANGVDESSQSAKDFADAEYVRRQTGHGTIPQPL